MTITTATNGKFDWGGNDYGSWKKNCHTGNTMVYTEPFGGSLFIGGWNQGATFNGNTHVIDLTGSEHKYADIALAFDEESKEFLKFTAASYAGWLSLPFPDMKVPTTLTTFAQWKGIAQVIKNILKKGTDVLVACHGGHGRSGLFIAIVGYLLAIDTDRSWSSPVEKVRKLHCQEAVETIAQEQFVYDILGLDIQIKRTYITTQSKGFTFKDCPICGVSSSYTVDHGMCYNCMMKYEKEAPVRKDMTAEDLKFKGEVDHACTHEKCIGIWKAEICKHVTHDMVVYEGLCEKCWEQAFAEQQYAEKKIEDESRRAEMYDPCAICEKPSWYADKFGVCYECSQHIATSGQADYVHNSITDPYKALPHSCDDVGCVGIMVADVCGHVIHNQEIEDGQCPTCKKVSREIGKEWNKE